MTNKAFNFEHFIGVLRTTSDTGIFYEVGNMDIFIDESNKIRYIRIDNMDKIQKEFLIRNGFRETMMSNTVVNFSHNSDSFERAKEIALKSIFAGILTLESGISFSKEARAEFAKHPKFIIRKKNEKMIFFDSVTKNAFWQTSPIKEIGKYQNGYFYFVTESGHKYQITTINN